MKISKYILIIIFHLFSVFQSKAQQQFVSCKNGFEITPSGLYYDSLTDKLIIRGKFTYADGIKVKGIATWDGNKFDSLGKGNKYTIWTSPGFMIRYKGKLFTQFEDSYIGWYDEINKVWVKLNSAFDNVVRDAIVIKDTLYLVGDFFKVGNMRARNIVKFDGNNFDTLRVQSYFSYWLTSIEFYKGEIYVGGNLNPPYSCFAKLSNNSWTSIKPNTSISGGLEAWDLQIYKDKLYICGKWTEINGNNCASIVNWDGYSFNALEHGLHFEGGISGAPSYFRVYDDKLFVGGFFDYADTLKSHFIAAWNGLTWCNTSVNVDVSTLCLNYKNQWYFTLPKIEYQDTVNFLGKYVGNNGNLIKTCKDVTSIKKTVEDELFEIYPNPVTDKLKICNYANFINPDIEIFNDIGQLVFSAKSFDMKNEISIVDLSYGVYYLNVIIKDSRKGLKFIKN